MKSAKPSRKSLQHKTILHILTGSISAYKACDLIQLLREEGARVICVLTQSAQKFITPLTVRAVSGEEIYTDLFSTTTPYGVLHTSLAEKADLVLVAPASANFIARVAAGLADDLASCVILATQRPVVIVPAMNDQMYTHPLTIKNIQTLREIGYHFVEPVHGHLVCGKEAVGHIADNEVILKTLEEKFSKKRSR